MDGWWLQTAEFLQPFYAVAVRVVLASRVMHTDDTSVKVRDAWRKLKYTGRFWPYVGDALHSLTVFDYTTNHQRAIGVVLASHVIHTDDTSVKVRDAWQKQKHTGHFWPYVGDELHPLVVFDYTPTHQRDGPAAFLKEYRGYLQADAFNGYDGIYLESQGRIVEVACWAHARRKFHECRRLDAARMETALAWVGKLYAVEKGLRELCRSEWQTLTLDERAQRIAAARQEQSRPLLESFHAWLEAESPKVLPKSPVRGAMDYTLSNWAALVSLPSSSSSQIPLTRARTEMLAQVRQLLT